MEGGCETASAAYIIRDHDNDLFEARKQLMRDACKLVNDQFGAGTLELEIYDQYANMRNVVEHHMHLVENAHVAYAAHGIEMHEIAMRGGTDGAQLSFRGLPCPNISACHYNAHSVKEFVPVPDLETMVDALQSLVTLYAVPQHEN